MEINYSFGVFGMSCVSCAKRVEINISKIPAVKFVSINIATEKGFVIADDSVSIDMIKNAVETAGYKFTEQAPDDDIIIRKFQTAKKDLLITLGLSAPLMILMFLHMFGIHIPKFVYIELFIGAAVLFFCGRGIIRGAVIAALHFHSNMDTLVSLSSFAALSTSFALIAGMNITSFGTLSAMLITFHLTGRYIEAKLKFQAAADIRKLLKLKADKAMLVTENGMLEVPIDSLKAGAEVIARNGDKVPADGSIIKGYAYVDESMLTGEPLPVYKSVGAKVIGGSIVNSGIVNIRIEQTGKDTFLNKLIKLVDEAQSVKIPMQALADRIILVFVPLILFIAVCGAAFWYFNFSTLNVYLLKISEYLPWVNANYNNISMAFFVFIAALVIACPCALGLAAPLALTAAAGAAAKRGLILKSGESIQSAKDIEIIIFDKTGTLTEGRPEIIGAEVDDDFLNIAAQLEKHSSHPLADSVIRFAETKNIYKQVEIRNIVETAGNGISCDCNDRKYFVGRPLENRAVYESFRNRGCSIIEIRENDTVIGFLAAADTVKADAKAAVKKLIECGITPVMATGDNKITAESVGKEIGISQIFADLQPDDKLALVRKFQMQNKKVAMLGDGINDAAALKIADIGIAVGAGADISIETADIILVKKELNGIIDALDISKTAFSKIKQNLFWAFIYNIVAIPFALSGLLHPLIAEIAMFASSINIILNSRINKQGSIK